MKNKDQKISVNEILTNKIIEGLQAGNLPWNKPWKYVGIDAPTNLKTNIKYRGFNLMYLDFMCSLKNYSTPYFVTRNQAGELLQEMGKAKKIKNKFNKYYYVFEEGYGISKEDAKQYDPIVFFSYSYKCPACGKNHTQHEMIKGCKNKNCKYYHQKPELTQEQKEDNIKTNSFGFISRCVLKYHKVYNIDLVKGLDAPHQEESELSYSKKDIIKNAEKIINNYPNAPKIEIRETDRACYYPSLDRVQMPLIDQFVSSEEYYSTFNHELIHSTGHNSRLNRLDVQKGEFADSKNGSHKAYAFEELVAEIGACFLNRVAGVNHDFEQTQAYINGWIKALKKNPKWIVLASQKAQAGADHILGKEVNYELG